MAPSAYSDVLARNIRAARSRLGVNQEVLASRMQSLGYSAWLRQTVANVEKGRRRVTAEEIFGLAYALETSIGALMQATADDMLVTFPCGDAVAAASVQRSAPVGTNDGAIRWEGTVPAFPEPVLHQLAAEGLVNRIRVNQSTGETTRLDPATGQWVKSEPGGQPPADEEEPQ
jgi:transcriptional regulator with XRE-family HTH domain